MIDPEPVEVPDEAEPTHVGLVEPASVGLIDVEIGKSDAIFSFEAGEVGHEDDDDELESLAWYVFFVGRTGEEVEHNLGVLVRKLYPDVDAYLRQTEFMLDGAVERLRRELREPRQFGT